MARTPRNVLSIQSAVCYGRVGNRAAAFALERLGFEVWPVDTVRFSNHPGRGSFRGRVADPAEVSDLIWGLAERGLFAECDAVLTGYLGDPAIAAVALEAAAEVRALNPDSLFCCDPVIGDRAKGIYVRPGLPEFFRDSAVPRAD